MSDNIYNKLKNRSKETGLRPDYDGTVDKHRRPVGIDAEQQQARAEVYATPKPTVDNIRSMLNSMSADTQRDLAQREAEGNPNFITQPDLLYGYGQAPMDFFSEYETPKDRPQGYRTVYDYFEEEGLDDYLNNYAAPLSPAQQNGMARQIQLAQNRNDYTRAQNLADVAEQMRNEQLYGETLASLLEQTPQGQSLLGRFGFNKPRARQRHITGEGRW